MHTLVGVSVCKNRCTTYILLWRCFVAFSMPLSQLMTKYTSQIIGIRDLLSWNILRGTAFQWMTSYQHIANHSAQLSMEICPSPSYTYCYGNVVIDEWNSRYFIVLKTIQNKISTMWFAYDDFLCRWIDDLMFFYFLWFNIDTYMSRLLL